MMNIGYNGFGACKHVPGNVHCVNMNSGGSYE